MFKLGFFMEWCAHLIDMVLKFRKKPDCQIACVQSKTYVPKGCGCTYAKSTFATCSFPLYACEGKKTFASTLVNLDRQNSSQN